MLRSIWLLFVYISFLGLSINAPFVATLGYVWVDTFQPQDVAYIILNQIPVAMIMGLVALGGYFLLDRRAPPPITLQTVLQASMAIWITLTMIWAQVPDDGWIKWDWAFKTIAFATFIPFVIRSRVQIEAFAQTYVFLARREFCSLRVESADLGRRLRGEPGPSGRQQRPGGGWLALHVLPDGGPHGDFPRITQPAYSQTEIAPAGVLGGRRTGGCHRDRHVRTQRADRVVVLGIYMWVRTKHKFAFGVVLALAACAIVYTSSSGWNARVSTIGGYQTDHSAMVRLAVWKWTLGFTATHRWAAAFMTYIIDPVEMPAAGDQPAHMLFSRAFHSIYFEVLGEQGYPGFCMFILLAASTFYTLSRNAKRAKRYPELQWVVGFSNAVQSGLAVFLSSGAFVGIAFQPMFWYFISMGVCLNAYMWRVERQNAVVETGWRASVLKPAVDPPTEPAVAGWRKRSAPAPANRFLLAGNPKRQQPETRAGAD